MRVMIIMKATPQSERGELPSTQLLEQMGKYNEELVSAGIMVSGEGLQPSRKGTRVRFSPEGVTVVAGPFTESNDLISGFWLWEVESMAHAVEWARRIPNTDGVHSEVELRAVVTAEDFGEAFTPELQAKEDRLREELERQGKK
jgi:hypothetical protein